MRAEFNWDENFARGIKRKERGAKKLKDKII